MQICRAVLLAGILSSTAYAGEFGPGGPTVITFESIPAGTLADGLEIGNVTFSSWLPVAARGTNPNASIGFFPITTPDTGGKGIGGNTDRLLGLNFRTPVSSLAFGFALQGSNWIGDGSVREAVTVELFDPEGGFLGSYSMDAQPAFPDDRGGGAEYASARFSMGGMRIGSANVSFPSEQTPVDVPLRSNSPIDRFFFDNLSFSVDAIPLPSPALMGALGLGGVVAIRRRRGM